MVDEMSKEPSGQKHISGFEDEQPAEFERATDTAARQRDASKKVLRARPIKGEVDHKALSREFMARFPKLRAACQVNRTGCRLRR
jgi:hypothetical protein